MADYRNRPPVDAPRELRIDLDACAAIGALALFLGALYLAAVALGFAW